MISVILNVYKRPYSLEKQIDAILKQSVEIQPENIHVWYNTPENNIKQHLPDDVNIKTYECNYNTKFFGRFTLPLLCKTPYIAIFDDDIICGKDWFKNCIDTIKKHNVILGGSGVLLHGNRYQPNTKVGWNGVKSNTITEVDLVGHAWFFKKEHAKFMWVEDPPSWDNGEDMFFSYIGQKNGVKTMVPPHPSGNVEMWSNVPDRDNNMGNDEAASWLHNSNHMNLRNEIVSTLINKGWKTVKNKK
ncbi:MAG: hypothetical protein ACW98X_23140 [Promethearchaeota archaeon]|jgi:hypothetical protein